MLSGGADSSIKLWDLEQEQNTQAQVYRPVAVVKKSASSHQYGITHLSFYPFDSLAFLSSSYDHTVKVHSTETMQVSGTFDLDSVVYSHAMSPIADHLLVACAAQHPAVRLVDLRTGASTHALAGHHGSILSVAWSPVDEHILASAGSDGGLRLWDIRRSAPSLGVLDMEDSIGIVGEDGLGKNSRLRGDGKAHINACNGVVWTSNGKHLVTAGHDERVRVWDTATGANALSHFGPIIKNKHLSTLLPLLPPGNVGSSRKQLMLYPNEREILVFELFDGTLLKRLRAPTGQLQRSTRITSLAWRSCDVEVLSAHSDGAIRAWRSETEDSEEETDLSEDDTRKRKREALDDVFRSLAKQKITFS
ncbi:MAG: hypothetical protein LQ351_000289 [Letrouitia transgressa]|nr:MAG: hypothetical protein LQ351_000289 [Letrouitia transgressa]